MNAIQAIKSKITAKTHSGGITLRKGLVVMQFAISQCLIISTFIIAKQMDFFQSKDLGFEKDAIVSTYLPEQDQVKMDRFRQKMVSNATISDVTYGLSTPTGNSDSHSNFNYAPLQSEIDYQGNFKAIDEGYEEFFDIPLLAGRYLQRGDSMNVVINRKIADLMGFGDDVSLAVGETLETGWGGDKKVVGVVENFHAYRLSESLDYVFFIHYTDAFYNLSFKIDSEENTQNALAHFRKTWEEVYPEYAIDYTFFDEIIENQYRREAAYSQVLQLFSLISIIIGCLGLYGLISFIANNRIKEIGIRKVLGASVYSILGMFSKEILTLVIVAFFIATPISYYLLSEWLSTYVFRISIGFGIFVTAFLLTLFIAIITISHRTITSARVNPASTLKDE